MLLLIGEIPPVRQRIGIGAEGIKQEASHFR